LTLFLPQIAYRKQLLAGHYTRTVDKVNDADNIHDNPLDIRYVWLYTCYNILRMEDNMEISLNWLERERDKAKLELDAAQQDMDNAQQRVYAAQKRLDSCVAVITLAKMAGDVKSETKTDDSRSGEKLGTSMNMADHIASILRKQGAMRSPEICTILRQQGREGTSPNSVNTVLSRNKGKKFAKVEDGRWSLIASDTDVRPFK
jgi:hypothetical protein